MFLKPSLCKRKPNGERGFCSRTDRLSSCDYAANIISSRIVCKKLNDKKYASWFSQSSKQKTMTRVTSGWMSLLLLVLLVKKNSPKLICTMEITLEFILGTYLQNFEWTAWSCRWNNESHTKTWYLFCHFILNLM